MNDVTERFDRIYDALWYKDAGPIKPGSDIAEALDYRLITQVPGGYSLTVFARLAASFDCSGEVLDYLRYRDYMWQQVLDLRDATNDYGWAGEHNYLQLSLEGNLVLVSGSSYQDPDELLSNVSFCATCYFEVGSTALDVHLGEGAIPLRPGWYSIEQLVAKTA